MKIKSNIQKIFAVLLLAVLAVGCTDEMADGDRNGIEEGKLVNVKIALSDADVPTIETRSGETPATPGITNLAFLQYKNDQLDHVWFTNSVSQTGKEVAVEGLQLLSGSDYKVFALANLEGEHSNGTIDLSADTYFSSNFGSIGGLSDWTKRSDSPTGSEVMLAVIANGSSSTDMLTKITGQEAGDAAVSDGSTFVNNIVRVGDVGVTITATSSLYGTFYRPYASVKLTIKGSELQNDVTINSVTLKNCPKEYSLVNGYSITANSGNYGDESYDFSATTLHANSSEKITLDNPIYVYENMAKPLGDRRYPLGESIREGDVTGYTYIEVVGVLDSEPITYRFILGKDRNSKNCYIERNVNYNVVMTITKDGGISNVTWEVVYEKPEEPEIPIKPVTGFDNLDAHATISELLFDKVETGDYYIVVGTKESSVNFKNGTTISSDKGNFAYNNFAGGFDRKLSGEGKSNELEMCIDNGIYFYKYTINNRSSYKLRYRQLSWFDYDNITTIDWENGPHDKDAHTIGDPKAVAAAKENKYNLYVYKGGTGTSTSKLLQTITITQYPPIVVTEISGAADNDFSKYLIIESSRYAYMERFDTDHFKNGGAGGWQNDESPGEEWDEVLSDGNFQKYMFDYDTQTHVGYIASEYCFWANPYGPLSYSSFYNSYMRVGKSGSWSYFLSENKPRYVIGWESKQY